jgi:hypothetical protein
MKFTEFTEFTRRFRGGELGSAFGPPISGADIAAFFPQPGSIGVRLVLDRVAAQE